MQIFLTVYSIDFNQAPNPINNLSTKIQEIMVQHHRNCEFLYVYQLLAGFGTWLKTIEYIVKTFAV